MLTNIYLINEISLDFLFYKFCKIWLKFFGNAILLNGEKQRERETK